MKTISSIREFICFNQKELIKYEFLLSEKHKELRLLLEKDSSKNIINESLKKLISLAYYDLEAIYKHNVELIKNIFSKMEINNIPVISIKTIEDGKILDFFNSNSNNKLNVTSIKSYTGFSEIMNSSEVKYYINNDLEKSFMEKNYKHPKIKKEALELLKNNKIAWKDCWKNNDEAYSSTLIIPMAIRIKDDDHVIFKEKFSNKIIHRESNRTVWGFLCFEYLEKNVFSNTEENDIVNTSYIIADILSLYLMFFYNHISGSKTFNESMKKINSN